MYFPPQCLFPGLIRKCYWYIVGLFCDACKNGKGVIANKTKPENAKNTLLHTGSSYNLAPCAGGGGCRQDCSVWRRSSPSVLKPRLIGSSGSYLMYAKMWSRQSVREAPVTQMTTTTTAATAAWLPPHGTWVTTLPTLTSDLPRASLVFPVFCISSCHTNLSSFFFFSFIISPCYIYIYFMFCS